MDNTNIGNGGQTVYPQDSIHPPDLIHFNMDSANPSFVPSVDSPLSTPPDTPRRFPKESPFSKKLPSASCGKDNDTDIQINKSGEEKKEDEDEDEDESGNEDPGKESLGADDVPIDEQENDKTSNSNEGDEFPGDEPPKIRARIDSIEQIEEPPKIKTRMNSLEQKIGEERQDEELPLSPTTDSTTPFDETAKEPTENIGDKEEVENELEVDQYDEDSAPEDEKKVEGLAVTATEGTKIEFCNDETLEQKTCEKDEDSASVPDDEKKSADDLPSLTLDPTMIESSNDDTESVPDDEKKVSGSSPLLIESGNDESLDQNTDHDDENSAPDDEKKMESPSSPVIEPSIDDTLDYTIGHDDDKSAPDDEKKGHSLLPPVMEDAKVLSGNDDRLDTSEEVMVDMQHPRTDVPKVAPAEKEVIMLRPVPPSTTTEAKSVLSEDPISEEMDELPSLSLVEKARKRLSAQGLATATAGYSKNPISPPRMAEDEKEIHAGGYSKDTISSPQVAENEEETRAGGFSKGTISPPRMAENEIETHADGFSRTTISSPRMVENEEEPHDEKTNFHDDTDSDSHIDEPPSLSRVEEAMKRTSLMVMKHNQRRERNSPPRSTKETNTTMISTSSATGTSSMDSAPNSFSESNRLAALQRDIMSLKSSLSNMNMQLQVNKAQNQIPLEKMNENNEEESSEEIPSVDEGNTFNDIPSTLQSAKVPIVASVDSSAPSHSTPSSPKLSQSSIGPDAPKNESDCLEKSVAMIPPNGENDSEKHPSIDAEKDDLLVGTIDATTLPSDLEPDDPLADEKDEIMTPKRHRPSGLKLVDGGSIPNDSNDDAYKARDANITVETTDLSFSHDKSNHTRSTTEYRKMTPKKDLQGSDKSHQWLQEELRRRAGIKREINNAIEARGQHGLGDDDNANEAINDLPSISSPPELRNSQSTTDEEVAAITAYDQRNLTMAEPEDPEDIPLSRKLDYSDQSGEPGDDLAGPDKSVRDNSGFHGFQPVLVYQDLQHEMRKFASDTRAALREQSFTDIVQDPLSSAVPVAFSSPMSTNHSLDARKSGTNSIALQMNDIAKSVMKSNSFKSNSSININFSDLEAGEVPIVLNSMDSFDGIATGDIFLSLLSDNTGRAETSAVATWAARVQVAIWRARRMRRSMTQLPAEALQSVVMSGSQTVASVQRAALLHLKRDEIDEATDLIEGITFAYYSYFERSLNLQERNLSSEADVGTTNFKPYIGTALHNLGVLNLLNGNYDEALSYFLRALENRRGHLGEDHPHYISSLVRLAVCRYALNQFAEAHAGLEEALLCARRRRAFSKTTLEDRLQMAEILNNLGCLAYMSGQPAAASTYYRDSMDIQFGALSDSLYLGNAISGKSISLNISIARANIGFLKLVTKDLPVAITAFENALMEQQILLTGTNETLIATMDHLALSNLLNGAQEKAALMYNRILTSQQREYGPHDRRCFVTVDKINMVQGKGVQYEGAIDQLRRTFSLPSGPPSVSGSSHTGSKSQRSPSREKSRQAQKSGIKKKKNKVLKALSSVMKKNP